MRAEPKRLARRVLMIVLCLLLGVNVYILSTRSASAMFMPFGIGMAVVQSGSMEPTLSVGDLLFIRARIDYAPGDIVVYQSNEILVVHRIIAINGSAVTTQGDANNVADAPFDMSRIRGSVVGRIPGAGYAVELLKTPIGILLLAGCAALLAALSMRRERCERAQRVQQLRSEIDKIKQELNKENNRN